MVPNKPRIQVLVNALRSGEFEQCRGSLAKQYSDGSRKYCCLGVATVLAQRDGLPITEGIENPASVICGCDVCVISIQFNGEIGPGIAEASLTSLIGIIQDYYGFDSSDPELRDADGIHVYPASKMNDRLKYNFSQIANAFERTFLRE